LNGLSAEDKFQVQVWVTILGLHMSLSLSTLALWQRLFTWNHHTASS